MRNHPSELPPPEKQVMSAGIMATRTILICSMLVWLAAVDLAGELQLIDSGGRLRALCTHTPVCALL